jgi:hypothetical protein
MVVGKERDQPEDSNDLILNFGCPMSEVLGKSVGPEVQDADRNSGASKISFPNL